MTRTAPTPLDLALVRGYVESLAVRCDNDQLRSCLAVTDAWLGCWAMGAVPRSPRSAANVLGFVLDAIAMCAEQDRPDERIVGAVRRTAEHLRHLDTTSHQQGGGDIAPPPDAPRRPVGTLD